MCLFRCSPWIQAFSLLHVFQGLLLFQPRTGFPLVTFGGDFTDQLVFLGSFYPVVEPPESKILYKAAIVGGCSHYVVTGYDGCPSSNPFFDELVIANEFSIVPAFILTISNKTKKKLLRKYHSMAMENPGQPQNEEQKLKYEEILQKAQKNKQEQEIVVELNSEQELAHIAVLSDVDSGEESDDSEEDFLLLNSRLFLFERN